MEIQLQSSLPLYHWHLSPCLSPLLLEYLRLVFSGRRSVLAPPNSYSSLAVSDATCFVKGQVVFFGESFVTL
jgi:hypothetical protein